jgi:hypothetical protein
MTGRINWTEVQIIGVYSLMITFWLHNQSKQIFTTFRYIWAYLCLEYSAKLGYDLIVNQNNIEQKYGHNILFFMLLMYCELCPKLATDILEFLYYGEIRIKDVPSKIWTGTTTY